MRLLLPFTVVMLACTAALAAANDPVLLVDQGNTLKLSNGLVSIVVKKSDATISTMTLDNSPNLAGKGAYFAVADSGGHDAGDIKNAVYKIERQSPDLVELSFAAPVGGVHFAQHYILTRGSQGFYVFVLMSRSASDPPEKLGQVRWSFYLNEKLFNYQLASDAEQGLIPNLRGAQQVQDATYRLSDGSVYTKYNYCTYIEEDDVHGLCGNGTGSYGAFIINPSKEFLQAPTKQEITVHAGPIIHRFLLSGHFEPRDLSSPQIPDGWRKLCGPWMVFLNNGDSPQRIWANAKLQFKNQQAQWPYQWMRCDDYPLIRGQLSGTLKLYNDQQPAANALMVLTAPQPDWQLQTLNYIFSGRADANGHFVLPNIRPGTYTLFAAIPGVTDEFRKDQIVIHDGDTLDLGNLIFTPAYYSAKLWEIGFADRKTTGFRLSDQPRQYGLSASIPADLTYNVATSKPAQDWYYAQCKPGEWKVEFTTDRPYGGEGVLTIGIAGQTSNPRLATLINGTPIGDYAGGNSSALYRSAILGSSYYENKIVRFPAALLKTGANNLTLRLSRGSVMYDVLKLEIDDPNLPKTIPLQ